MTRIARTALSMLASAALLLPTVAQAQSAAAAAPPFAHDEIMQCYKASAVYFIFSADDDHATQDSAVEQIGFWLDQMDPNMAAYDAELDAFVEETAAAVKAPDVDAVAAGYLTKWADAYAACSKKWETAGGTVVRKIESPVPTGTFTRAESQTCMFSTIAVMIITARDENANLDAIDTSGRFWADQADSLGAVPEAEEAALYARLDTMMADAAAAQTPEQAAAFLAPYQADFTACEAKMKAATGA